MMYPTDYDIYLNTFLCLIDMFIITELRERIYGHITRRRNICIILSIALVAVLMLLPDAYGNSFLTLPASLLLLPFYPKCLKKKLLFEVCLISLFFTPACGLFCFFA